MITNIKEFTADLTHFKQLGFLQQYDANVQKLYNTLMYLCENDADMSEAIFYKDYTVNDTILRIFNYRLITYTQFHENPSAFWARGITFSVDSAGNMIDCVCVPMKKFFNFAEGDVAHENNSLCAIDEKLDGSLISTFVLDNKLMLKSKGSPFSEQAKDATEWLNLPENKAFAQYLYDNTLDGFTVNLEWTSPKNRIVVGYDKPMLRVLNMHSRYFTFGIDEYELILPHTLLKDRVVKSGEVSKKYFCTNKREYLKRCKTENKSLADIVNELYKETEGEGYVLTLYDMKNNPSNMYQVKVKNRKYVELHTLKDALNNPKNLAALIIKGESDDIIEKFSGDESALKLINDMEKDIAPVFNHIIATTEKFYTLNKNLSRKDYAIKAQKELDKNMSLAMNLYIDRPNDYEEFCIKNMTRLFGISNTEM